MNPELFKIDMPGKAGGGAVSARFYPARGDSADAVLILAHGAGAGQDSPFMVTFARELADRGLDVFTFNFPYMEGRGTGVLASPELQGSGGGSPVHKRTPPTSPTALIACYRAVVEGVRRRSPAGPLFVGGKSMGGRVASMMAAEGGSDLALAGLVFLGYPLHPPGRPGQLRVSHWPLVKRPALFVQGSRDTFGSPEEIRRHLPTLGGPSVLVVVDGGDHSFKVARGGQRHQEVVHAGIQDSVVAWVRRTL